MPRRSPIARDPSAVDALARLLDDLPYPDDDAHPTRVVRATCLARSAHLRTPDFEVLADGDLELLFDLYDREAFRGLLSRALPPGSPGRPHLRASRRMTRTAGKTTLRETRVSPLTPHRAASLEIAISLPLLAAPIDPAEGVRVAGLACRDRLEVLQRIFEHELVHALLFCLGSDARCGREAFRSLAFGLFGHTESKHHIGVVRRETGAVPRVRVGDRVRFEYRGVRHEGIVNRITRRATVLVPDPRGRPYEDGERYAKYYVPLSLLTPIS